MATQFSAAISQDWSLESTLLHKFAITKNGFLPDDIPLKHLSDSYYEPWELVIAHLPALIGTQTIRVHINRLQVLSTERLRGQAEWRRAYVILGFLAHAYIWGGDHAAEVLPLAISIPLRQISKHLELPPVATYAALNLWNFTITSRGPSSPLSLYGLESFRALHTFTGTSDESWFYIISVAVEAQGSYIIPVMLNALESLKHADHEYATTTTALVELSNCISRLSLLLDRLYVTVDPYTFYHRIRPFLAGSKNMEAAGLPRGVFYDEGDGSGSWMRLRGGSNGQSSLIQFFDVVLGVVHTGQGNGSHDSNTKTADSGFHYEVRDYMPGPHRRFLEYVEKSGSIREFVASASDDKCPQQTALRLSYRSAVEALTEFRNKHLQIVTRYIVIPSRHPQTWLGINLASVSSRRSTEGEHNRNGKGGTDLTGTGGTALLPFLKQARDETRQAAWSMAGHLGGKDGRHR